MRLRFEGKTLVKVLIFTIVSLVLTVLLAVRISNSSWFDDRYALEAEFANASGVFDGDAVKLAGVDVGRVTGTAIENGKAVVEFEVDDNVKLTTESLVGIRWRNVIGLRFLYLYPGSGGGRRLEDGDRIPLERTETAGDIGEFLNRLGPILRAIDPDKANAFLNAVNTALVGNETSVRALFSSGSALAGELGELDSEIETLIGSSDQIMGAYASQSQNLGRIIDDLDTLGGELAGMTEEINSLVTNFAVVQQEMTELLQQNRGNIDATIANLDSVAGTLSRNREALGRVLCSSPAGLNPYDLTSSWGEWFNVRIVELVFKDEHGNIISRQQEGPDARADQYPAVYTCPDNVGEPESLLTGGTAAPGAPGSGGAAPQAAGGVGLEAWLQTVIGGAGG